MTGSLRKDVQPDKRPKSNQVEKKFNPPPDSSKIEFLLAASNKSEENLFITGDFDLHVENPNSTEEYFPKLIKSDGLVQHVEKPTHEKGGILDLITTNSSDLLVENVEVGDKFSDHKFVQCMIQIEKKKEDIIKKAGPSRKDVQPDMRPKESAENVKENDMGNVEVKCGLVNARSLKCKTNELKNKIVESNFDFVAVTETWNMSDSELKKACPKGFKFKYKQRKDERQGGGIALFFRDSIKSTPRSRKDYETFVCLGTSLDVGAEKKIRLLSIYRPPDSNEIEFLEEFKSLLAASNRSEENLFITGDFNLHVKNPNSTEEYFLKLIKSYGLVQHVKKKEDIIKKEEEYVAERGANKVTASKNNVENVKKDMLNVEFGLVNARSLRKNVLKWKGKIANSNFDFVAVTETWIRDGDKFISDTKKVCPKGFEVVQKPRIKRRGGGVAIFYRESIGITQRNLSFKSFECLDVFLNINSEEGIRLINIYRPPGNSKDEFLDEFQSLLQASAGEKGKLLITGDFNLNVENPDTYDTAFLELIKKHDLEQHVKEPTQEKGGILDLIITTPDLLVKNVEVDEDYFSDHKFVQCMLQIEKKKENIFEREE
ncbi:hypothetical protein OUZ56_008285 [Daphnia magna]|uniref:Endonuclease/exonuclease/phosphatase domain-containing protein n=1 Tax=Daphnia magna TaxID=35525 RepID=A0ABR0ACS1_9CRUS|nr:hypothetical protein OUZ56_008285 [Daphnia magna]